MKKNLIILIVAVLVVGSGSFFAGMAFANRGRAAGPMRFAADDSGNVRYMAGRNGDWGGPNGGTAGANRAGRQGGGFGGLVAGEILKLDGQSLAVKLPDGSTRIVLLSEKTAVTKSETGAVTDLATGLSVRIDGSTNSDGSVTAQSVQILPIGTALTPPANQPPVQPQP